MASRTVDWTFFKERLDGGLNHIWDDQGSQYALTSEVWCGIELVCQLAKTEPPSAEQLDYEVNYKNRKLVSRTDGTGAPRAISDLSQDVKWNLVSANLCNRSTWVSGAAQVIEQDLPEGVVSPSLGHAWVIDVTHGLVPLERQLRSIYAMKITVPDGGGTRTLKEREFHYQNLVVMGVITPAEEPPYDYEVNYATGKITFQVATLAGTKASYWYAGTSVSVFPAPAGYEWQVIRVEIQFTTDVDMLDAVVFQAYGGPPGGKFPFGDPIIYETLWDLHAEANKAYPKIEPIGSANNMRGTNGKSLQVMNWEYGSATPVRSDQGGEVRISLEHNQYFGGTYATATMYGLLRPLSQV